ncbi:MAG: hypothetical protein ABI554_14890 [Flavobacterium sp.]
MSQKKIKQDDHSFFKINHYYYLVDSYYNGIGECIPVRLKNIDDSSFSFINLLENNEFEISANNEHLIAYRRLHFSEKLLENLGFEKVKQGALEKNINYELFGNVEFLLIIIKEDINKQKKIIYEKRLIDSGDNFNGHYPLNIIIKSGRELKWVEDLFYTLYFNNFKKTDKFVKYLI